MSDFVHTIHDGHWCCGMPDCGKKIILEKKSLIVYHRNTHFPKYECTECGKFFPQKSRLEVHIRTIHTGEKPYCCGQCDRTFPQMSNLNDHMKNTHISPQGVSTPYGEFYKIHSKILMDKNPGMKYTERVSAIGKLWQSSNKSNPTAVPGEDPGTKFTGIPVSHIGNLSPNHLRVDIAVEV